jgi:hypothetical protein
MRRLSLGPICMLAAGWLLVQPARAADIYFSGSIGNSVGQGEASTTTDFYTAGGEDSDVSPNYGGTIGLAFAIDEAFPTIKQYETPDWLVIRTEFDFMYGRDYQIVTDAPGAGDHFLNEFNAWTLMPNFSVEAPVREPISWLFGRIPILEPMSIYGNIGLGIAMYDFTASDNNSSSEDDGLNFAWQGGAGFSYTLTDTTTFVLGYRYVSMGDVEADVEGIVNGGDYEFEMESHEVVAGLRINFYTAPLKDMNPRYWRGPRMPGWMPSWLGGPSDEPEDEESGADTL